MAGASTLFARAARLTGATLASACIAGAALAAPALTRTEFSVVQEGCQELTYSRTAQAHGTGTELQVKLHFACSLWAVCSPNLDSASFRSLQP